MQFYNCHASKSFHQTDQFSWLFFLFLIHNIIRIIVQNSDNGIKRNSGSKFNKIDFVFLDGIEIIRSTNSKYHKQTTGKLTSEVIIQKCHVKMKARNRKNITVKW